MTGGLAGGVRPFFMIWTSFFNLLRSPPIQCGKKTKTVTEAEGPLNYESHRLREWLWQPERPMRSTFSNSCNGDLFLEIVFWMKHKKNNHLRTKGRPAWSGRWGPLCCYLAVQFWILSTSQHLLLPAVSNMQCGICTTDSVICHRLAESLRCVKTYIQLYIRY